jgi:hypothetical protein
VAILKKPSAENLRDGNALPLSKLLRTSPYAVASFRITKTRFCLRQHGTRRSFDGRFSARTAEKRQIIDMEHTALPKAQCAGCVR